jgi:glycosidase
MNLPAGSVPYNGRLANVPDPSNAQFYPDHNLTPVTFSDPATGQSSVSVYPFNTADPMDGTPEPENGLGYLMRYTQWMVQVMGVDGFRIDAAKNMPPWVLNYYDQAVFRESPHSLLNGSQEPIFGFSEVYDGDTNLLQQYVNKSDNGPNVVGGDRDVLDFPLFFALQGNLTGNGYQNNWTNVVNASVAANNGYANNGSEGVSFVSSADNGPPYLQNVAYAYTLTHPGNTIVYFNGHSLGANGSFPADGRGHALRSPGSSTTASRRRPPPARPPTYLENHCPPATSTYRARRIPMRATIPATHGAFTIHPATTRMPVARSTTPSPRPTPRLWSHLTTSSTTATPTPPPELPQV